MGNRVGKHRHRAAVVDDGVLLFLVTDIVGDRGDTVREDGQLHLGHALSLRSPARGKQAPRSDRKLKLEWLASGAPRREIRYQLHFLPLRGASGAKSVNSLDFSLKSLPAELWCPDLRCPEQDWAVRVFRKYLFLDHCHL